MDSKRLRVMKALSTLLGNITIINGFQQTVVSVARGRSDFGSESAWPLIGIFEVRPEDLPINADETVQKDVWVLGVQGVIQADHSNPTDPAHNLLADIKKSIGSVLLRGDPGNRNLNYMFGDLVVDMKVDGGITFSPVEQQGCAVCLVKLSITIQENLENPYE